MAFLGAGVGVSDPQHRPSQEERRKVSDHWPRAAWPQGPRSPLAPRAGEEGARKGPAPGVGLLGGPRGRPLLPGDDVEPAGRPGRAKPGRVGWGATASPGEWIVQDRGPLEEACRRRETRDRPRLWDREAPTRAPELGFPERSWSAFWEIERYLGTGGDASPQSEI